MDRQLIISSSARQTMLNLSHCEEDSYDICYESLKMIRTIAIFFKNTNVKEVLRVVEFFVYRRSAISQLKICACLQECTPWF